jgi:hypothetical protein
MSTIPKDGPWWVWGDPADPYLTNVDYITMKEYVDEAQLEGRDDVYGEDTDNYEFYYGE